MMYFLVCGDLSRFVIIRKLLLLTFEVTCHEVRGQHSGVQGVVVTQHYMKFKKKTKKQIKQTDLLHAHHSLAASGKGCGDWLFKNGGKKKFLTDALILA